MDLRRPSRAASEISAERIKAEQERLSALTIPAAESALRITVRVWTTGFVEYECIRHPITSRAAARSIRDGVGQSPDVTLDASKVRCPVVGELKRDGFPA
jgi:hypothetical protein